MKKYASALMVFAVLSMGLLFVLPMWKITLLAPQYPTGISINIWINDISGDISNFNIMNHYVGMRKITTDGFPELAYMQYILIGMIILGLVTGIFGKKKHYWMWVFLMVFLGIIGLYDFYRWEYNYGHNLDPFAAIKVPGMAYQPPFFGRKELLNFIAYSYPAVGGYFVGISIFIAALAAYFKHPEQA
ncbi:MAG: hypothetical protein KGZ82_15420 [Bacteroidales bacterium]|nr:hypothetical protein [Bacteroidales bacterium]